MWCASTPSRVHDVLAESGIVAVPQRLHRQSLRRNFIRVEKLSLGSAVRIQCSGDAHCGGERTCGVYGARQLAVVDSVAVVEEFEVVPDAMAQVRAMAVPSARYAGSGIAGANGCQAITGRHACRSLRSIPTAPTVDPRGYMLPEVVII